MSGESFGPEMLRDRLEPGRGRSLIRDYSALLAESVLRRRAWFAEHSARVETELASKVKSEFIANMSHELRTPLNTIIGFAKLLAEQQKRRLENDQIVEYADLIRDAATHLLAVINDILDISKLQSGKYTVDSREVDLDEVLQAGRCHPQAGSDRPRRPVGKQARCFVADGAWRCRQAASSVHQPDQQFHQIHPRRRQRASSVPARSPMAGSACASVIPAWV